MSTNTIKSFVAGADLSGKEGYAVKLNASVTHNTPQVVLAGADEDAIGILVDAGKASGSNVSVCMFGTCMVYSVGTVALGALVASDANGKIITKTPTDGDYILGRALQAGTAGGMIEIFFNNYLAGVA